MKKLKAALLTAGLGIALAVPLVGAQDAEAHGWVTNPPSRQDHCSTGSTSFDCGGIKYEPQSVEAPKGSMKCSGGNEGFSVLDDESRPWPVTKVNSSVDVKWKITARHSTSTWDYFLDGDLIAQWDDKGARPNEVVTHSLTNLPSGKHTILARWNVADTINAFYSCIDIEVTGGDDGSGNDGNNNDGNGNDGNNNDGSGNDGNNDDGNNNDGNGNDGHTDQCAAEWSDSEVYLTGDEATVDGKVYRANWWTQGNNPAEAGEWGAWTLIGDCDHAGSDNNGSSDNGSADNGSSDNGSDADGNETDGNDTDGNDQDGNDNDGAVETCDAPAWSSSQVYNGGDEVSHDGAEYRANWWTQGDTPKDGSEWGVWVKTADCAA